MTKFQIQKEHLDDVYIKGIVRLFCDIAHCELDDIDELRQAVRHMDGADMFDLYADVLPDDTTYDGFFTGLNHRLYKTDGLQAMKDELMNMIEEAANE